MVDAVTQYPNQRMIDIYNQYQATQTLPEVNVYPEGVEDPRPVVVDPVPAVPAEQLPIMDAAGIKPPLPEDTLDRRAFKASFSDFKRGKEELYNEFKNGREDEIRGELASDQAIKEEQERQLKLYNIGKDFRGPMTIEQSKALQDILSGRKPVDPGSVIEDNYAKSIVGGLEISGQNNPDSWVNDAKREIPAEFEQILNSGRGLKARKEFAYKLFEDAEAVLKTQGLGSWGVDMAKALFPLYQEWKLRGWTGDTSIFKGLLGDNLNAQVAELYTLPYDQFKVKSEAIVAKLAEDNPMMAVAFASALVGQSMTEKTMNNFFSALDITGAFGVVKGVARLSRRGQLAKEAETATKQLIKDIEENPTKSSVLETAGDIKESAITKVNDEIVANLQNKGNPVKESFDALTSVYKDTISGLRTGERGAFSQGFANQLAETMERFRGKVITTVLNTLKVERLPVLQTLNRIVRAAAEDARLDFPGIKNLIGDSTIRQDPVTKGYFVDHYITGPEPGKLFGKEKQARAFIKENNLPSNTRVDPVGSGYTVVIPSQPLKETQSVIRDSLVQLPFTQTHDSFINSMFKGLVGRARTPEEVLAQWNRINRQIATYAPNNYRKLMTESAADVNKLSSWRLVSGEKRLKWKQWNEAVNSTVGMKDADGNQLYFRNLGDLSQHWSNKVGRLPDEQEAAAYFAWARGRQMQNLFVHIQEYSNLSRVGTQEHTIKLIDTQGVVMTKVAGKEVPSKTALPIKEITLTGVKERVVPTTIDSYVRLGKNIGEEKVGTTASFKGAVKQRFQKNLDEGKVTLIRISNPEDLPLKGVGTIKDERIRFVVVENVRSEPLKFGKRDVNVAETQYNHYLSQAIMRKDNATGFHWYEGDTTIGAFNVRAMAHDVVRRLNTIREHLAKGDVAAAKKFYDDYPLGMDFSRIHGWFEGPGAKLNVNEPIRVVDRNKRTLDTYKTELIGDKGSAFRDGTRENLGRYGSNKVDIQDLFTLRNEGTRAKPLYSSVPVEYIDPSTAMNRAYSKVINSTFMNDYKIYAIEHWIQEAKKAGILDVSDRELAASPYYHFYNPKYLEVPTDKQQILTNLQTARFQIQQFTDLHNSMDTSMFRLAQTMSDSLYTKVGERTALVPLWAIGKIQRAPDVIRSIIFNEKLGIFNPVQLLIQANSFVHIYGLAGPKYAGSGTFASLLHLYSTLHKGPAVLAKLDEIASRFNLPGTSKWKPGQLTEARQIAEETGFSKLGSEYALAMDDTRLLSNGVRAFLNAGQVFFRSAEKAVRWGAWYTAYREFRDASPTGPITAADKALILHRADFLSANMSKASSSMVHEGVMSFPAQFYAYPLRVAETFLGHRLDRAQRVRLFGTYAAVYGVPGAFGLAAFPLTDLIRKAAIEDGYVPGENFINDVFTNGIPSVLLRTITGQDWNISERMGPGGLGFLKDLFREDISWYKIPLGVTGDSAKKLIQSMDPFVGAMTNWLREDDEKIYLQPDDFIKPFEQISTVKGIKKVIEAFNFGKWYTDKGKYFDITPGNAIFSFLSGLTPQEFSDAYNKQNTLREENDRHDLGIAEYVKHMVLAAKAAEGKNEDTFEQEWRTANAYLKIRGVPENRWDEAMHKAANAMKQSVPDATNWEFYASKRIDGKRAVGKEPGYFGGSKGLGSQTPAEAFKKYLELREGNK